MKLTPGVNQKILLKIGSNDSTLLNFVCFQKCRNFALLKNVQKFAKNCTFFGQKRAVRTEKQCAFLVKNGHFWPFFDNLCAQICTNFCTFLQVSKFSFFSKFFFSSLARVRTCHFCQKKCKKMAKIYVIFWM